MKTVINNKMTAKSVFNNDSYESDRVALVDEFMARIDFDPEKLRMTPADCVNVSKQNYFIP